MSPSIAPTDSKEDTDTQSDHATYKVAAILNNIKPFSHNMFHCFSVCVFGMGAPWLCVCIFGMGDAPWQSLPSLFGTHAGDT